MNNALCIGMAIGSNRVDFAMLEVADDTPCSTTFPAGSLGSASVESFLADFRQPMRIAVAGASALEFALALESGVGREVVVSFAGVGTSAVELAHYAKRLL